jgi:hypothetical protein
MDRDDVVAKRNDALRPIENYGRLFAKRAAFAMFDSRGQQRGGRTDVSLTLLRETSGRCRNKRLGPSLGLDNHPWNTGLRIDAEVVNEQCRLATRMSFFDHIAVYIRSVAEAITTKQPVNISRRSANVLLVNSLVEPENGRAKRQKPKDFMVAEAVAIDPVSTSKFPGDREINREV